MEETSEKRFHEPREGDEREKKKRLREAKNEQRRGPMKECGGQPIKSKRKAVHLGEKVLSKGKNQLTTKAGGEG